MRFLSMAVKIVVSCWLVVIIHELGHVCAGLACGVPIQSINLGEYPYDGSDDSEDEIRDIGNEGFLDTLQEGASGLVFKIRIERELTEQEWMEYLKTDDDVGLPKRIPVFITLTPLLFPLGGYVAYNEEFLEESDKAQGILLYISGLLAEFLGGLLLLRFSSKFRLLSGAFWRMTGQVFSELLKFPVPWLSQKAKKRKHRPGPLTVIAVAARDEETGGYPWLRLAAVITLFSGLVEILPLPEGDSEKLIRLSFGNVFSSEGLDSYFEVMLWAWAFFLIYLIFLQIRSWLSGPALAEGEEIIKARFTAVHFLCLLVGFLMAGFLGLIVAYVLVSNWRPAVKREKRKGEYIVDDLKPAP